MNRKSVIGILVLASTLGIALVLWYTGPKLNPKAPEAVVPSVRTVVAMPEKVQMVVHAQGTVVPRTISELVPEVSGRVLWVSSNLVPGGYFKRGDPLLRIDDRDYRDAVARATATVDRTTADLEYARHELERLRTLASQGLTSTAEVETKFKLVRVAETHLAEAEVMLQQSERDLSRTELQAPFSGLVESEHVDAGQFVSRGVAIARLYAADYVEVRLPIADRQLAYLDIPHLQRGELQESIAPLVVFSARFAGRDYQWEGKIVRIEAVIDLSSRLVYAVARIDTRNAEYDGVASLPPPLGLFVQAEIQGRSADDIVVLPRSALHGTDQVLVVEQDKLRFRTVSIARVYGEHAYVDAGLTKGEQICITALRGVVDGMSVNTLDEDQDESLGTTGS